MALVQHFWTVAGEWPTLAACTPDLMANYWPLMVAWVQLMQSAAVSTVDQPVSEIDGIGWGQDVTGISISECLLSTARAVFTKHVLSRWSPP